MPSSSASQPAIHPDSSEDRVAAVAAALVNRESLTLAERRVLAGLPEVPDACVEAARAGIAQGGDPLGEQLLAARTTARNRNAGATYTPPAVVAAMVDRALRGGPSPARVVDPGAGSGRFAIAAARAAPDAAIIAAELDPLTALVLRANLSVLQLADRVTVHVGDFRNLHLPPLAGTTVFVGNPPYVRHHEISREWKEWYSAALGRYGIRASQLAGLHLHFFAQTLLLAGPRDRGLYITAAEWLDVNYGSALRELLVDHLGLTALDVVDPGVEVFPGILSSAVITSFAPGTNPARPVQVRWHRHADSLASPPGGLCLDRDTLRAAPRWTPLARGGPSPVSASTLTVGDLFRVSRGQVTGANHVWVTDPRRSDLPARFLWRTVTRAAELISAQPVLRDCTQLKVVVDLPADLDVLPPGEREAVEEFLARARAAGADASYVARQRKPWHAVRLYAPAPILCTYMGRRPPVFVVNEAGARHINVVHGLYPRQQLTPTQIRRVVDYLNANVARESGRTYAGGLTKFEPREIERLPLPRHLV